MAVVNVLLVRPGNKLLLILKNLPLSSSNLVRIPGRPTCRDLGRDHPESEGGSGGLPNVVSTGGTREQWRGSRLTEEDKAKG